jgi:hypothetical protein
MKICSCRTCDARAIAGLKGQLESTSGTFCNRMGVGSFLFSRMNVMPALNTAYVSMIEYSVFPTLG